jgi:hypothetical protein
MWRRLVYVMLTAAAVAAALWLLPIGSGIRVESRYVIPIQGDIIGVACLQTGATSAQTSFGAPSTTCLMLPPPVLALLALLLFSVCIALLAPVFRNRS